MYKSSNQNNLLPLRLLCVSATQRFRIFHRRGAKAQSRRRDQKNIWPIFFIKYLLVGPSFAYCLLLTAYFLYPARSVTKSESQVLYLLPLTCKHLFIPGLDFIAFRP